MDTAERRKKRRLCFIEGKTTDFISNRHNFTKEKFQDNRKKKTLKQNKWTFFRTLPIFRPNHAPFREKPIFGGFLSSSLAFPRAQTGPNGHAPTHIAHSASLHFLPSPFTFTHNTLIIKRNKGEDKHRFNTSQVKAKNEKRRTRVRVRALGPKNSLTTENFRAGGSIVIFFALRRLKKGDQWCKRSAFSNCRRA